ncbi:hypothetical protein LINPERHAP1_LOCUS15393, partial [Linum perenne]
VNREKHSFTGGKEVCKCIFTVVWQSGPWKGCVASKRIENICMVQSESELDPAVLQFSTMASNEIADACSKVTFVFSVFDGNKFNFLVSSETEENEEDADLGGHIPRFALLVDNLEKHISPSALMHLIHQETSLLVGVRISPIMYPETFTKAVIVVESVEQLEELCKFLDSPSHFVVSESGRPLVVTEKNFSLDTLARPMENLRANGLQGRSIETNCGLRVVKDGSVEYEAAKRMKVFFMEFVEHEKIMIEDLAEKEKDIMES